MSIFDRIRRITQANIDRLLDKVEPPEKELESRIKELEETILQGRESAAAYGASFKRLESQMLELEQKQAELKVQAENAVRINDEAGARAALTEKVKVAERISQLKGGVEQGRNTYITLKDNIIALQEQLKAARLKFGELKARKHIAAAQNDFDRQFGRIAGASDSPVSFDRFEDDVFESEAEVEIRRDINGQAMSEAQLARKSRQLQVEAELQSLKDSLQKK